MGWKGLTREMERSARRRQRELERQQKLLGKMQEIEKTAYEVQVYENHIDLLLSVHKECGNVFDWAEIKKSDPPVKPSPLRTHEDAARSELNSTKIGLSDKLLGRAGSKKDKLIKAIEDAKRLDESEYLEALKAHEKEYSDWNAAKELADKILLGDIKAYSDAIKLIKPFSDINQLGSSLVFGAKTPSLITASIYVNSDQVIPSEIKSLTKSGKLSVKQMPKSRFYEIYQDYVCSSVLRIARELFALLPVDMTIITAMGSLLNTKTGHMEEMPILSAAIPRKTLEKLNYESIDPSDSMNNFVHRMDFKKSKGFLPVEAILPSELQLAS